MWDWITDHLELTLAIIAPASAAIGYIYHAHREKHQNLKEALYLLLEIWHQLTAQSSDNSEQLYASIMERFSVQLSLPPEAKGELDTVVKMLMPAVNQSFSARVMEGSDDLHSKYAEVVQLVAKSDPVFAYQIECVSSIQPMRSFVEQDLTDTMNSLSPSNPTETATAHLQSQFSSVMLTYLCSNLEKTIRGLAWRISLITYFRVVQLIRQRHSLLAGQDKESIDKYMKTVITPLLTEISASQQQSPSN